eukprot:210871_1
MSYYYVDPQGATKGPLGIPQLKALYAGGQVKDATYIWNGGDIAQWTAINKLPQIWKQLKPQPKAPSQPGGAPKGGGGGGRRRRRRRRRKSPFGGGGRGDLLSAIKAGRKLTKTPAPVERDAKGAIPGGGGGGGGGSGRPLSLMEQMKLAQQKRKKGGGGKKRGGGAPKKRKNAAPKKNTNSNGNKQLSWSERQKLKKQQEAEAQPKKKTYGGQSSNSSSGTSGSRKDKIISKIKTAEEWQLKAIAKILGV